MLHRIAKIGLMASLAAAALMWTGACAKSPMTPGSSAPLIDNPQSSTIPAAPSGVVLSKSRRITVEFTATFGPIKPLAGEALSKSNRDQGVPEALPPTLLVWSAGPPELAAQNAIEWIDVSPEPAARFNDKENGNLIHYWDLSDQLTSGATITITRCFAFTAHEWTPLEAQNSTMSETSPAIMALYTREEPFIQLTDTMRETAQGAIAGTDDTIGQARRLFDYVRGHMTYVYPPAERNALHALNSGEGDCGQYSYLFIALCRSIGIPARQQSGFRVTDDGVGYHVWSEFFAPPYGWIPVDATEEDGFARLDNERLVASVGTFLPLEHVPAWATLENSDVENGRTDFMQFMTVVRTGFHGRVATERRVVKIENLE